MTSSAGRHIDIADLLDHVALTPQEPTNDLPSSTLKPVDTIGNCQRPVFSFAISQHMHKITNLWKFELDWSSELRDNYERKKHPCHTKLCVFRCLISGPQILNLRSRNQVRGNILLSRKLPHFIGSRFSQCFILPTCPHYSLTSNVLW